MGERAPTANDHDVPLPGTGELHNAPPCAGRPLELLLAAATDLGSTLSEEDLRRRIVRHASALAGGAAAFLAERERDILALREWWDGSAWHTVSLTWQAGGEEESGGPAGRVPALTTLGRLEADRRWVCAPVEAPRSGARALLGALAPASKQGECARVLEGLARLAAVALSNARLFAAERQDAECARAQLALLQAESPHSTAGRERQADRETLAAIGHFAQTLAHDLKNSLSTIRTVLFSLQRRLDPADERATRACGIVTEQVARADRLLLDAVRLTLQEPPALAAVPVAAAVAVVLDALNPPAGVRVSVAVPPDLPAAWADIRHVQQILESLCGNAIQAVRGDGALSIKAECRAGTLLIRVTDTGCGIAPEDLPHVFRPLWEKRAFGPKGFGISLAVCRELAERNGGSLTVESVPGKGSTFTLALPRAGCGSEMGAKGQ